MTIFYRDEAKLREAIESATKRRFVVGVDLGQSVDPTAIAVLEKIEGPDVTFVPRAAEQKIRQRRRLHLRHLERVPLGTTYPDVVAHVGRMIETVPLQGNAELVIDQTGVGRAVFDLFAAARLRPIGVTITAGDTWMLDGDTYRIAKLQLVSRLQAVIHSGELAISPDLPLAAALKNEFADFRVRFTEGTGVARFGAREGRHDDLILALAIAVFRAALPERRVEVSPIVGLY